MPLFNNGFNVGDIVLYSAKDDGRIALLLDFSVDFNKKYLVAFILDKDDSLKPSYYKIYLPSVKMKRFQILTVVKEVSLSSIKKGNIKCH